jgi:hypothetical protein
MTSIAVSSNRFSFAYCSLRLSLRLEAGSAVQCDHPHTTWNEQNSVCRASSRYSIFGHVTCTIIFTQPHLLEKYPSNRQRSVDPRYSMLGGRGSETPTTDFSLSCPFACPFACLFLSVLSKSMMHHNVALISFLLLGVVLAVS